MADEVRSPFAVLQEGLAKLEEGLSSDNPEATVQTVFDVPPKSIDYTATPCIVNRLFFREGETLWARSRQDITVPVQVAIMCYDNDPAVGERQAIGLLWELMRVFMANQTVLGQAQKLMPTGVGPVGTLEYPVESGRLFQSANLQMDIKLEIPQVGGG